MEGMAHRRPKTLGAASLLRHWTEAAKVDRHGGAEVPVAELFSVLAALVGGLCTPHVHEHACTCT
jgi:hypothetical protein